MNISLSDFVQKLIENPLLLMSVLLTLGVILVNGWTDAPNAIATCVTTRCMSVNKAILMASVFNFLGVFIMTKINATVAMTITNMINLGNSKRLAIIAISSGMIAIVFWATLSWIFGIPTSESHALIAGLSGSMIALHNNINGINLNEWMKVIYGIFISIILGFVLSYFICKIVIKIFNNKDLEKSNKIFKIAQIISAGSMSFMHGAQDGQKFMAIILLCLCLTNNSTITTIVPPNWLMLICSIFMGLGTLIGGKKIIKSVGMDMVKLEKYQGFSADLSSSITLLLCSIFSLPVSTTHVKTSSLIGVGIVKSRYSLNLKVVKEMILTWVLTFPGCGIIGFLMTKLFISIF